MEPEQRLTAAQALVHPWIDPAVETPSVVDLLPNVRKGFNAGKTFKKAIKLVQTVNQMKSCSNLVSNAISVTKLSRDTSTDSLHTATQLK